MARGKYPMYRGNFGRVATPSRPSRPFTLKQSNDDRGVNVPPMPQPSSGSGTGFGSEEWFERFWGQTVPQAAALRQAREQGFEIYDTGGQVPLGVTGRQGPAGYFVGPRGFGREPTGRSGILPGGGTERGHNFLYFDGDQYEPEAWDENRVRELQQTLSDLGLLSAYAPGVWDQNSAAAYAAVMGYANQRGITVGQSLQQFPEEVEQAEDMEFPPLITQLTPTADLRTVFREASTSLTGQGMAPEEIEAAIGAYHDLERATQEGEYAARYDIEGTMDSEAGYGPGGEFEAPPSPDAFLRERLMQEDPGAIQEHSILGAGQEALQFLSSPQWGQGLGGARL